MDIFVLYSATTNTNHGVDMIEGSILTEEYLYRQEAKRQAALAVQQAKKDLTTNRRRFLLTLPEEIADQVKEYANALRDEFDKQRLAEAAAQAEKRWTERTTFADWQEARSIEFWATR